MMAGIFFLQVAAISLAWSGERQVAVPLAVTSLGLAALLFAHHATSQLGLSF